jgi:hypothetical protein
VEKRAHTRLRRVTLLEFLPEHNSRSANAYFKVSRVTPFCLFGGVRIISEDKVHVGPEA